MARVAAGDAAERWFSGLLESAPDAMVIVDEAGLIQLGVGQIPHQQTSFAAPAGSILALYTDGLVETRDTDLDLQIDKAGAELQAACTDGLDLG